MRMLRLLSLMVFVVFIAAFASGCGGGGGGGGSTDTTPPATTPDPTPDPEPDDSQRISSARASIAGILASARTRAQTAQSVANQIQSNADATAEQITRALNHSSAAQSALAAIQAASSQGIAATTAAQAETALANARAASGNLDASASALASIQGDVQAAANRRRQLAADEAAQTGGSSLIKHLRDNRIVSDEALAGLAAASLLVGETGGATGSATYPFHKSGDGTAYPRPRDADRGVLGVTVSVGVGGTDVSSNSQTGRISGSGRLSNGFDLKDGDGNFATVYTDIAVASRVRAKNTAGDDAADDDTATEGVDERYTYVADADYLLAGIWLDDSATDGSDAVLRAFAFGSQALAATHDFCTAADVTDTATLDRECSNATDRPYNTIAGFVDENESEEATYRGGVNGAYFAGGKASHFRANVSLTAKFVRGSGEDVEGSKISGAITDISAGGNSITGSIDLKEVALANDISGAFGAGGGAGGDAAGVIEGHAYTGSWKGRFFGMRARRLTPATTGTVTDGDRTTTTTYTPDKPGSVAGSFYVNRQTVGEGDAAFIGAFGAHR